MPNFGRDIIKKIILFHWTTSLIIPVTCTDFRPHEHGLIKTLYKLQVIWSHNMVPIEVYMALLYLHIS